MCQIKVALFKQSLHCQLQEDKADHVEVVCFFLEMNLLQRMILLVQEICFLEF